MTITPFTPELTFNDAIDQIDIILKDPQAHATNTDAHAFLAQCTTVPLLRTYISNRTWDEQACGAWIRASNHTSDPILGSRCLVMGAYAVRNYVMSLALIHQALMLDPCNIDAMRISDAVNSNTCKDFRVTLHDEHVATSLGVTLSASGEMPVGQFIQHSFR